LVPVSEKIGKRRKWNLNASVPKESSSDMGRAKESSSDMGRVKI